MGSAKPAASTATPISPETIAAMLISARSAVSRSWKIEAPVGRRQIEEMSVARRGVAANIMMRQMMMWARP